MTDTWRRTQVGVSQLLDGIAPWLIDLGNWIFGGLIGFNVVILGAVLTIVPIDGAVKISTAASALALPPSAAGLVMLRLLADLRSIRQSPEAARALQDAGVQHEEALESEREAAAHRRSTLVRRYAYLLMILSFLMTLAGVTGALWHVAWWIGVVFVVVLGLSVGTIVLASAQLAAELRRH